MHKYSIEDFADLLSSMQWPPLAEKHINQNSAGQLLKISYDKTTIGQPFR